MAGKRGSNDRKKGSNDRNKGSNKRKCSNFLEGAWEVLWEQQDCDPNPCLLQPRSIPWFWDADSQIPKPGFLTPQRPELCPQPLWPSPALLQPHSHNFHPIVQHSLGTHQLLASPGCLIPFG